MSESEIIQALRAKIANNMHVAMPGVIESYAFKEQRASVRIPIKKLYNSDTTIDYPIISGVPVIFPRSGGASITMPVNGGDSCLVMFLDQDLRAWLLGGDNLKPKSARNHHLSDAVAIMGLSPFTTPSLAENNTDVLVTYDGSQVRIKPKGIIDIHSAKELDIKTENIIINCKMASVKAEESITSECKNLSVKVTEIAAVECKTANIKVAEDSNIECKNANIKAIESVITECKNAIVKASENISIECIDASLKSTGDINAECVNATIKATGTINTETPTFTQKGNLKVDGKIEVTGTSKLVGDVDSNGTIKGRSIEGDIVKTTTGKDLATHTHLYTMPIAASTPTGVVPNTPTGTAI